MVAVQQVDRWDCLQVLTLIMLENKILIQSRDLNALSLSVLALTHLLYTLQAGWAMPCNQLIFAADVIVT